MLARGRGPLVIAAALALLVPAVYWRMLMPGWAPIGYDEVTYFVPLRHYLAQSWASGRWLPLWDPELFLGAPFLANIQDAALYPLNLLFGALPTPHALAWSLVLHLSIAGVGMFLYALRAERLRLPGSAVAALAFIFGGYLTYHLGHLNQTNTLAWAPWLMLATDRLLVRPSPRRAGLLALVVALVILAGHTQQAYMSFVLAAVVGLRRLLPLLLGRAWRPAGLRVAAGLGAAALGASVAALQLLSTVELSRLSIRSLGLSLADASVLPLPGRGLLAAVLPDYSAQQNPETTAWIGMAGLFLAAVAVLLRPRRRWPLALAGLAVLGLWAALGTWGVLYTALYHLVPGIGLFRVPGRLLLFTYVASAILAGHGVRTAQQLAAARARGRRPHWAAFAAAGCVALVPLGVIGNRLLGSPHALPFDLFPTLRVSVGLEQLAFAGLAAAIVLGPAVVRIRRGPLAAAALPVLVAVELVVAGAPAEMRHPLPDSVYSPSVSAEKLAPGGPDQRFLALGGGQVPPPAAPPGLSELDRARYQDTRLRQEVLQPDTSLGTGRLSPDGYDGGVLPLSGLIQYRRPLLPPDSANNVDFPIYFLTDKVWSADWLRDSGVANVITPDGATPNPPGCTDCLVERDAAGGLVAWAPTGPAPTRAYVLAGGARQAAHVVEDTGDRVRVWLADGPAGTLVLSDAWYPGWTATVDGKPATIDRYHDFLRAVAVPAGASEVDFEYRPGWLVPGLVVSSLALVASLALLAVPGRLAAPVPPPRAAGRDRVDIIPPMPHAVAAARPAGARADLSALVPLGAALVVAGVVVGAFGYHSPGQFTAACLVAACGLLQVAAGRRWGGR